MEFPAPVTSEQFLRSRRDLLLAHANYAVLLEDQLEAFKVVTCSLQDLDRVLKLSPKRPMTATHERATEAVAYLHLQYSAGAAMAELGQRYPLFVSFWEEYAHYHVRFHQSPDSGGHKVPHLDLYDDEYWRAIRLTSFAFLLGHTALLPRVAALWDYENDDMDGLLERLVAPFCPGRATPPDTCTRHLPYFKLLKVFAAAPDKRPALMAKYMDGWYSASRREPYYESHTPGREHSYLGLWSFEAAAVAYFLDIDDSSFRDKDFYPRDLADYARSLPRPLELGGTAADDL